jgi:hypothetical protein
MSRSTCTPKVVIKDPSPKHEVTGSKSLAKLTLYSTSDFASNNEAMSRGTLSGPLLIGSTFVQIDMLNPNKTSDEKRGINFHE